MNSDNVYKLAQTGMIVDQYLATKNLKSLPTERTIKYASALLKMSRWTLLVKAGMSICLDLVASALFGWIFNLPVLNVYVGGILIRLFLGLGANNTIANELDRRFGTYLAQRLLDKAAGESEPLTPTESTIFPQTGFMGGQAGPLA